MAHEQESDSNPDPTASINAQLADDLAQIAADRNEELESSGFELQSPQEFRDSFISESARASHRVKGIILQLESGPDTDPIYESMIAAQERGVRDVELVYEPASVAHISRGASEGNIRKGKVLRYRGDKSVVQQAHAERQTMIKKLQGLGIIATPEPEEKLSRQSHNHIKLFIVDNVAWIGSMNLRESDFAMSNAMIKITNPELVEQLTRLYDVSTQKAVAPNETIISGESEILFDGGNPKDSVIYTKAVDMIDSLQEGDEVVLIGQYAPVKMMYGRLLDKMRSKMERGVKVKFLTPPTVALHPVGGAARWLQKGIDKRESQTPNMEAITLARKTHLKAMIITRANGEREVLFGSHNLTSWTVRLGNKELSIWSNDPEIVDSIASLLDQVEHETI